MAKRYAPLKRWTPVGFGKSQMDDIRREANKPVNVRKRAATKARGVKKAQMRATGLTEKRANPVRQAAYTKATTGGPRRKPQSKRMGGYIPAGKAANRSSASKKAWATRRKLYGKSGAGKGKGMRKGGRKR